VECETHIGGPWDDWVRLKYEMTDYWTGEPLAIDDKLFPRNVTTTIVCLKCVRGFMRGTEGSAPFDQGCATRAADFAAID
jgi:hypothetical protein